MKQAEKMYLISDAAKQVQVEAHVLRYWEEELALPIRRNELGHRYYTEEDIERFKEVRDLKEQGLQLKAIRSLLNRANPEFAKSIGQNGGFGSGIEKADNTASESIKRHVVMINKGEFVPIQEESREAKSLRLQQLLQNMIAEAVRSNNREVCEEIKESLLKELDYQFRLQEEREEEREEIRLDRQEEHYRKIDELIRSRNKKGAFERAETKTAKTMEAKTEQDVEKVTEKRTQQADKQGKRSFGFLRKKRSIN